MDNDKRKKVYDVLTSQTGYKDSFEDFNKFMNDRSAREKVYGVLRDKTGYKDSFDDFENFMSDTSQGVETASVVPQQRPSLHEQVDKSQLPVMEDLPWMKNTGGQNGMLSADNLGDRLEEAYKRGDFEPFRHREEDARIRNEYTPRQVVNEADIMENAKNRFALTERGRELGNEFASIRKEKTDRYLEEFKNSDEYKAIVSRKPETQEEADAVNNAVNELFSQKYGARLEEEMQPYNDAYHNEVLSRYGAEIKAGLTKLGKKSTSEQVAGLTEEVNALLEKEHEVLKQHGGSGNNAMNALMGSAQYNQATGERRKEIGALESARKLLENSREIINEAGKAGNTNFAAGLIRGVRDNFDADKWTFGLAEMADAKYLNNALEKSARGETLTPAEEKLLDASTINMAAQAYFSSDLGRGYKAGSVTAESLPFMLEFLVNPISGSGNTIAKGLLKYGLKRFGSAASTKGARIAGRMIGDSAAALGMEGTTGIGRVAAGTLHRLNQNYETSFNDDGEVEVKKTGDMGIGEALARSGASTFLENQSEMIFNAFRAGGKAAKKAISDAAPGMSERTANRIIDFYNKVRNNKTLKSVSDRAQFHGLLEEYGEEVYNNMANVAIGEMSAEDAFDVDNNIDTFLGLAPTSLAFATLGIGGLVSENIQAKKRLRKFVENLNEEGREVFSELWDEIEKGHDTIAKAFVKRILTDESLSAEEKKDRIFSVRDMINARNTEQEIGEAENETVVATEEVPIPAIDKVNVYRNFKRAERKVAQLLPGISEEMLNSITDVDKFAADNNLNDAQKAVVSDYVSAREPFGAYLSDTNTSRDAVKTDARERASADVDKIINKDNGFVVQAKHKFMDNPVYITRGNLVFGEDGLLDKEKTSEIVYYRDENGDIIPVSPDKFDSILSQNTKDELVAEAEAQADADFVAQEEESLASPDIPVPERGVTVAIKGENYLIEGPDEDNPGNVLAYKLDANGEIDKQEDSSQVLSLSLDEYYSAKEAELWNNGEQTADIANPGSVIPLQKKILPDGRLAVQTGADESEVSFDIIDENGNVVDSDAMPVADFSLLNNYLPETEEIATDIPVSEIRETGTGEVTDTVQGVNTSENQPRNESTPSDGDSKVSEEEQEETPEQKMQRIIDSLPKKKDGKIDYKALTPRQQYDYTSVTESEEVAASDLREEISAREKELKKMNERLTKVTGGERAEVRDAIRERRTALDELQSFYNTIAPASVEQQAEAQDNSIPNDLRTDEDYISWVADNSDDVKEVADAYAASKELASHEQTLKPWQRELLGRRISSDSFNRFGDRNHITGGLAKAWLRKDGEEIDTLAQELSTFGGEVTEQDIVDFILANPSNRVSQISDDMRNLSRRFSEIASKELGFLVGGPESNTGKLYLQLKEAKAQVDNLTDAQKGQFVQAVAIDMDDADSRRADGYYESLGDYAQQYDQFRNELDAEAADKALIQMMEDNLPQLYHGGFTADELDDIYSQIENNNGTKRQAEDSRENQSPLFGEEVEQHEESGTPEVVGTENSEGEEQNSGVALNLEDNSVSLQEDNQKVNENDEISESIPQGEHGTETSQDGGLEEALAECRRRSSQDERYAQANSGTLSERERKEIENRAAENYAKEKGVWIPMQKVFSLGAPAPGGNENYVYLDTKDNSVYKVNNLMNSGNVTSLLERLKFHNEYFPDTKYELVGFSGFENGDVFPVLKQRYIEGADFATPEEIDGYMRSLGFKQRDEATYSNGDVTISDLRPRNVLKDADGDIYVIDADFKKESGFAAPSINPGENVLDYAERISREKGMHDVRRSVNTNPTEAQKEAGNYKKGHLKLDGYNITIENPKGSVRSGTDANGQAWSVTMNNDYGYIRGTKAVDGDHIDIFLSDTPMEGNVFVVDQNKEDGTFDESKVMYGFASAEDARTAYLSNYSSGWENRIGAITEVSKDEFKKWVSSSVRKTKPFADYKGVKSENVQSENQSKITPTAILSPENSGETEVKSPKSEAAAANKKRSDNRLVTDERYEELKQRMKRKLGGQMNMGIDPEILAIGTEMAVYHLEKGARRFSEYATAMIADLGDVIRPYLKAFYNGARNLPEVENSEIAADMTPYDEVQLFNVSTFGKEHIDPFTTTEIVVAEQIHQEEVGQEKQEKPKNSKKKNVTSKQLNELGLFDELFTETNNADVELHRTFAMAVKTDMLAALDNGTKPYRSILDLRKRASELGMKVDKDGRTDILLQELVEDGLVRAAREVIGRKGRNNRESYDLICKLYEMQPTIAARSSNRIKMQQYSTPLPMAWIANRFAMENKADGKVLDPTAGNGMLVFTVSVEQVHVNELDETRLDNLREQGFAEVTQQDATEPFEGGMQYDVVLANPPFGKREATEYEGKMIPGLDPQITLNALASMKDDGRAAIIIGGNMEYASNGAIKSMKPFFTYLYDHYNVKGVIDMSGGLYAKQGTTFPTRMILIDGRRSDEERAQTAIYPPVESKAIRKAESFDDLYEIINEVLNSKEKTNGTEILRSRQGQLASVNNETSGNTDRARHREQSRKNDDVGSRRKSTKDHSDGSKQVLPRERRTNITNGETRTEASSDNAGGSRSISNPAVQRVGTERVPSDGVGLNQAPTEHKKRTLTEGKSAYRPHNSAFSLNSVAPAAMVEAMDNVLTQIEKQHGSIDEFIRAELGYDTVEEAHQALAAEQMDSVAMAIYQMKQGQALIIGDQTGVGKGRQMAALIRWAAQRGEKPVFITQKADLFSDIYRDLVDVGSGDLVPFIFNSDGTMVDSKGNTVHKPLSSAEMARVFTSGTLPDEYDFAVLTYSQVNTGDAVSQQEMEEAAKKSGSRTKKSKNVKNGKATPKATFLRAIAEDNYLFLDESHTAAGSSNTGAYLQSILRTAKAATFASATFAKRPDTMPLYAIRTAISQAKVEPDKMISIIEKGGVTLQEIMSRELANAGQMVRRERDMSDVITNWKTITDPETARRARENYDRTIAAFNAIIKFQEDYVKPMIEALDMELAVMAESAGVKRGTDKMGVENVPFASKTYNYTKQLMLALKVDAIADEVEAEINAGRHPVIALESTMESIIKDYAEGEIIDEPTFSASLLKGLDTVMQYTVKDNDGNERHERYSPQALGPAGEKAYYELQDFIRESTSDIFVSPLDAIIERLHAKGYRVGELTGRNMYVERNEDGRVVVKRRTDKDKKRMQREFNNGILDVLILNKSASTGISLHASERFSDQRQRSMIIAQPLSDINDYMQMIGRIDRTGQVHRGYYINLGLPVPAENRFLMMLSTKLKSLNANTTTSQDSESNDVEAPDLLNKYGSQVVVEYLRDNVEIYEKMGTPLKKNELGGGRVQASELDEYKPQEDDARKVTGYVALLTTKEQEEFYDDVVRRYNELIKYLNDTGSNDLKINIMPLRAKTIERRVSSEGIDPNGNNPFARNSFVEKVEMDVLRKPMKADEIRKAIEQINRGIKPTVYLQSVIDTIRREDEARIAAEEERYERAKAKAVDDIAKQTEKINGQKKRSEEEKRVAIENFITEANEKVEAKHNGNILRLNQSSDQMMHRLRMFEVGKSYLVPDNIESMIFDFVTPAIFCGYKTKESKITASTTLAVFATLDGRRRIEIKLSQIDALRSIDKMTNDNWDAARATTLDNWDSQIPSETRKTGLIMTGNILQAIADTQDEHGGYPGQLISYTDIDGNVHDGILMPDKWNASMLKTSGSPLSNRLQQIKDYVPVTSHDGKVEIMGSSWSKMFYLTVPKTKKDGSVYYENKTLLRAAGGNFYPYRGKLRADIPAERIDEVVKELTRLGVKVKEENHDELQRDGVDLYTDDELALESDPVSKLLGKPRGTRKQRREFAQRERQRMVDHVNALVKNLRLDNVEVVTDTSQLEGNKQRVKGFYAKSTGEITIVIPNHSSVFDAVQTLLHEAVAHYGLRQLFGEHFDTFLDNVFNNADEAIRKRIDALASKNGWDFRKATEEYLAMLAENTEFENTNASWWRQIKDFFLNMLHKIGFEGFRGVTLTDNELRYILWRSYENLAEPGRYRSILGEATDIAMQYELKVGNYAMPNHINVAIASDDTLFRDATEDTNSDSSIERYEEELNTRAFKAKEAYQDSMLALKKLQDVIVKKSGKELKSFEDAYTAENHLSSKNTAEVESYGEHFFRPIIDAIGELMNNGITYEDIKRYVFAKHGLERNEVFAQRDAHNATIERFWKEKEQLERQYSKGKLMEDEYEEMKQSLQQKEHDFYEQQYQENRSRDYSGLTTLTGEKDEYEKISQEIVEEFEKSNDTSDLWKAINNATKETLKKTYECGLINKGTYEKVKSQFKCYIPLRGWNEKTAEDVYEYLQSEISPVNATLKTAKGRMSLADDPFATIGNMAESNIFMSNRNLMKQRFMNMVLNHPSDAVSLSEAWYVRDASTGDWVLSSPDIQEKDTPEEIRRKIEEHEDRMQELAKNGDATKVKEGLNINYRISDRQAREHMIVVKRNGKEYVMYINGNPRAAQAINGLTNPNVNEHPVWKWIGNVNRQLAANFTTRNPAFVATNLSRDLIYSVSSTYAKEGTVYGNKFIGNIPKAMRVVARNLWGKGGNSPEDIYFKEYLANGGETGYANLKDVEAYKKFVKKEIGKITGKKDYFKYLKACASFFSLMNRWAENVSRFNAYMTSREMGKNIFDSVSDAKEVTVNFNKKGAGYKTKGVFGLTSGTFKELFLFFNAAVQSLNNFSKIAVNHKSGFIKMVGGFTTAGFIIPALNTLATSMLGGDDDYYNNLPEWVRRNNICVYVGSGKFITIPLPIELRAFYGLGEMAYQETIGRGHGGKRIVYDAINQIMELLPINPLGNNGDMVSSFTPDIAKPFAQLIRNKDYTGKPIYKENPFNQYMPEWTKTYSGTSKWLKSLSEWTNDITGGNKYKRGWMNVNPAKVEHLFESYFGGMAKTINQASNTLIAGIESVINSEKSEDLIWRNAPVLNRFVSDGSDDRTAFSKVNSRYYELYDIYVDVKHQLNGYKKEISSGNFSYLEELSELQNSKEYDIYKVFEQYRKSMDELKKLEKSFHNSNKDGRREIEKDIVNIKKKIIENIDGK